MVAVAPSVMATIACVSRELRSVLVRALQPGHDGACGNDGPVGLLTQLLGNGTKAAALLAIDHTGALNRGIEAEHPDLPFDGAYRLQVTHHLRHRTGHVLHDGFSLSPRLLELPDE
jgi:hypothetical protein